MSGLEGIVRPFARPNTLATRRLIASNAKLDVRPATITWGQAGTIASAHQVAAIDETGVDFTVVSCDDRYDEVSTKVDVRRIVQKLPNGTTNPDNFIDLERPYEVFFEKKELASSARNGTQTWVAWFPDSAVFGTVKKNKCQATFTMNRA
jgi:hypothetical protein